MIKREFCKCDKCSLQPYQFVAPLIPKDATLLVIGEAPGKEEVVKGIPFIGDSGKLLRKHLPETEVVHYTNVCLCRPPDNSTPPWDAIEACKERLDGEIANSPANKLIALGDIAMRHFISDPKIKITKIRGSVVSAYDREVLITFHPAYILRNKNLEDTFAKDINRFLGKHAPDKEINLNQNVVVNTIPLNLKENVSFDIETSGRYFDSTFRVLMLSVCDGMQTYIFSEDFLLSHIDDFNQMFSTGGVQWIGFNGKFDVLGLKAIGILAKCDNDPMLLHYLLHESGVPHGLKSIAQTELGIEDWQQEMLTTYKVKDEEVDFGRIPFEVLSKYCAMDSIITWHLYFKLKAELNESK